MSTPVATINWSGREKAEQVNGSTIEYVTVREYTVVDAVSEAAALAAAGLPTANQEFEPGSPLRAKNRTAKNRDGPTTWTVRVDYGVPPSGEWPSAELDPLQRPPRISWGIQTKQVPMELDVAKTLVQNSAGDFFDPLPTRDIDVETLTIRRFEPFYDRAKARKYRGRVNSNTFIVGNTAILPYECRCVRIGPTQEFESTAKYVEIEYAFEIDIDSRSADSPDKSGKPFDAHVVDRGIHGFYNDGGSSVKRGFFCTYKLNGSEKEIIAILSEPILLDGKGKPLTRTGDSTLIGVADRPAMDAKVYAPVESPASLQMTDGFESPFSSSTAKVWLFMRCLEADFSHILD